MKKWIGILLAVLLSMNVAAVALAEGALAPDVIIVPPQTELPEETEQPTDAPTDAPTETDAPTDAPDTVVIAPATEDQDGYKDLLMDTFKQTSIGQNTSIRAQVQKILYLDDITVSAENYTHIILAVNKALKSGKLSDGASLSHYTDEDLKLAVELIDSICDELDLGYSIDPSNDSQNEYARVITITKNGKVLGKINSDAKTDLGELPPIGWIIGGGVLITAAAAFGLVLVLRASRRKETD